MMIGRTEYEWDRRERVVTSMPVEQLWTDSGDLAAVRGGSLDGDAIRELLRRGPVRFVVANVGHPLEWIPAADRFAFWKNDAAVHLSDAERINVEDFPDRVAYVASEWLVAGEDVPIVLFEAHH